MSTLIMEVLKLRYVEQERNVRKLFKSVIFVKLSKHQFCHRIVFRVGMRLKMTLFCGSIVLYEK